VSVRDRSLPDFPWNTLAGAKQRALEHPDGIVDLSVGTPVDPTPELGQRALIEAANAPGYPTVWGTPELRAAIRRYLADRWGSVELTDEAVLPVIGTKELVAQLPFLLGLGEDDLVIIPEIAYPTYEVGARLVDSWLFPCDDPSRIVAENPALVWINSPANPHGSIMSAERLADWVTYCRERGAVLAVDECYAEFGWDAEPVSVLNPLVNGGSTEGVLALHALSKRSNAAGYRAGFVAGDEDLVSDLRELRKHAGGMVPAPVQAAMTALLGDQQHVVEQRERYLRRRQLLRPALEAAGFRVEHSEGALYLWCTRDEPCRDSVDWLAERGILVAPGDFYGAFSDQYIRVALTATDERIAAAVARLTS
jgi:succinyldiaminopimelate transaminase